jgi:predicted transcriptional regulator
MPPSDRALLVSIRPCFASLLLSGDKTVELRRTPPSVEQGTLVLMYASSPARELVGVGHVERVDIGPQDEIWREHGHATGLTRDEFDRYFAGAGRAVAITVSNVRHLKKPKSLAELRRRWSGFRPPQSFRYLSPSQVAQLTGP